MAFSSTIFHEQNLASFKLPFFTNISFYIDGPIQQTNILAGWCFMKIVIIGWQYFPENNFFYFFRSKQKTNITGGS